jgi:hypothetical protein
MVKVICFSRVAGLALLETMICIKGGSYFLMFNYHCGTAKFYVKIFDGTQCHKKYTPVE